MDAGAKRCLLEADAAGATSCRRFPLEPIACFVGKDKTSLDTGEAIPFWVHCWLAREALVDRKVLTERQFDALHGMQYLPACTVSLRCFKYGRANRSGILLAQMLYGQNGTKQSTNGAQVAEGPKRHLHMC